MRYLWGLILTLFNSFSLALAFVFSPFSVILKGKAEFFVWFMFTIIAGQIGVFANILLRFNAMGLNIENSIYMDSISGSFYTFGIAISTSALGPIFINFLKKENKNFNSIKVITSVVTIFFVFLAGIIYASSQLKASGIKATNIDAATLAIDYWQLSVYAFSIFICIYCYCLMILNPKEYEKIDDKIFHEKIAEDIDSALGAAAEIKDDGNGVIL